MEALNLGKVATSPYSFSWNNVASGTYSITAVATDNLNLKTTSSAIAVTVSNGTINTPPQLILLLQSATLHLPLLRPFPLLLMCLMLTAPISKVEFFNGSAKLGEVLLLPIHLAGIMWLPELFP